MHRAEIETESQTEPEWRRPWWLRILGWMVPRGRVRLALAAADAGDEGAEARLETALETLSQPGQRVDAGSLRLRGAVLERLAAHGLRRRDLERARQLLDELEAIGGSARLPHLRAELGYWRGRRALRRQRPEKAAELLHEGRRTLAAAGNDAQGTVPVDAAATVEGWLCRIDYWHGVALAHQGRLGEARKQLETCRDGSFAERAEAQIALLDLAAGDAEQAASRLARLAEPRPASARYLGALLAHRRGEVDDAEEQLGRLADDPAAGVYAAASRRLLGSLAERRGDAASAEQAYRQVLREQPADPVASARLARLHLRRAYHCDDPVGAVEELAGALDDQLWADTHRLSWGAALVDLRDLLVLGKESDVPEPLERRARAFQRLTLHRLLATGRGAEAAKRTRVWAEEQPEDRHLAAVHMLLDGAATLHDLAARPGGARCRKRLQRFAAELAEWRTQLPDDRSLAFWHDAARLLLDPTLAADDDLFVAEQRAADAGKMPRSFAAVAGLFAAVGPRRSSAIAHCRKLQRQGGFTPAAGLIVDFLLAAADARDDQLVAAYSAAEQQSATLPVAEVEAYLAVCEASLRLGRPDAVVEGTLPEALADLTQPDVRRIMGMAYALRATHRVQRDARGCLRDLGQAMELLADSEGPSTTLSRQRRERSM